MSFDLIKENNFGFYLVEPNVFIDIPFEDSIKYLDKIIGEENRLRAFDITKKYESPVANFTSGSWLKKAKIIGINPKITKTFWGIVKYAMTFPEQALHIMPLWETGVKGHLYIQNNWNVNTDFLDSDLISLGYETAEKQLKLIINVLHALGKTVGFDALPHVDNYSEIVLVNPKYFEWIKLNEEKTSQLYPPEIDYNTLYKEVENVVIDFLEQYGDANENKVSSSILDNFFSDEIKENERIKILFGENITDRYERRKKLIKIINEKGYSTIPETEHMPLRPVQFKEMINGWPTFEVKDISKFAKIFGNMTPYKWYYTDENGCPRKNDINKNVWQYFSDNLSNFQKEYNFDFMRCDMAHNQIAHAHNEYEKQVKDAEEFWAFAKNSIQSSTPYFATLAEAFLHGYYIDATNDMINKKMDVVLGCLNFKPINSEYFTEMCQGLSGNNPDAPFACCLTVMTNDSDKKEQNKYYQSPFSLEIRIFMALFLNEPLYMPIGIELRDLVPNKLSNYSTDYAIYKQKDYQWGSNTELFDTISEMRYLYSKLKAIIENDKVEILKNSDENVFSWLYYNSISKEPLFLFVINVNTNSNVNNFDILSLKEFINTTINVGPIYSNLTSEIDTVECTTDSILNLSLNFGECRIYKIDEA